MARQFAQGYIALQTHGGNDRISYREIQVKEFTPADMPVNTVAPTVTGSGYQGNALTCNHGTLEHGRGQRVLGHLVPRQQDPADNPRFHAPSQNDYSNFTTPAEPEMGTSA